MDNLLAENALTVLGIASPRPEDELPTGTRSIILLGPDGPRFWDIFTASPEYKDGSPNPVDRWSSRVITAIAGEIGGTPLFPFGGPPYRPFISWALSSGEAYTSPVGLLVHTRLGLMVSFRGAIAVPAEVPGAPQPSPCESCVEKPCLSTCPVGALGSDGYDLGICHDRLDTDAGQDCMRGCLVRRACPVGQGLRTEAQSAHHMRAFHPGGGS